MTYKLSLYFFVSFCLVLTGCKEQSNKNKTQEKEETEKPTLKDTITYRAEVWAEKEDVARLGDEDSFEEGLEEMFKNTTEFFNSADNKFEYYFEFVPRGMKIYDNEGDVENYHKNIDKAGKKLDTSKYDYQVFLALDAEEKGSWAGGGELGQSVVAIFRTQEEQEEMGTVFEQKPPQRGVYSDLAHEYGHMRGATDLYQYIISAEDNPVNHQEYKGPMTIMVSATDYKAWSDYESYLFNYTAHQKQLEPDLNKKIFPDTLQVKVLSEDDPVKDVSVKLYGTRAGGAKNNRDVYPEAFKTYRTDEAGEINITDVYELYHPSGDDPDIPPSDEFPYAYWFSFVIEAEHEGEKEYAWVPDWETQITKLKGGDKHQVLLSL